jgi:hypothetical protein
MKFRYLIVDEDGQVSGTNDGDLARIAADADYTTVVDAGEGKVLGIIGGGDELPETCLEDYVDPDDEGEDD